MISYKFRLYPSKEQQDRLEYTLDICRRTYNELLSELNSGFTKLELSNYLLDLKACYPEMKNVYSKSLQVENDNLFRNLKGLSESKKNGNKVGRLRFKGKEWKKTFTLNQSGFRLDEEQNKLKLSKIGEIKVKNHRLIKGKIKQIVIKKEINNWFAIIQTDETIKRKHGENEIGLDFGLIDFITDNNGNKVKLPKEWSLQEKKIKCHHQKLSRTKKGSNNRKKTVKLLQKSYNKLNNQKNDFFHKLSTKLVTENKVIYLEDLSVKDLMIKSYNAKNFQKSAWSRFVNNYLINKAESADCQIIFCDRFASTSQECSSCGRIQKIKLSERIYNCSCGLILDRDENAARNILKSAKSTFGIPKSSEKIFSIIKYGRLGISLNGEETNTQSNEQCLL